MAVSTSVGMPGRPIRLTRRGRCIAAVLAVSAALVAAAVTWLGSGGAAEAAGDGRPGSGYQGMHQVVVRPGQTLWGIAYKAEPQADPFQVMQQIIDANALAGTTIRAGQVLWVPDN
jgi:LysM domain